MKTTRFLIISFTCVIIGISSFSLPVPVSLLSRSATSTSSSILHSSQDKKETQFNAIEKVLQGNPSFPGWNKKQLSKLTDWAVSHDANRPVICEYEPDAKWLWTRWTGTVLSLVVLPVVLTASTAGALAFTVHTFSDQTWPVLYVPPADDPFVAQLLGVEKLYKYLLTLCTFILTFFTSEAYNHWKKVYFNTRAIQGRVNDICLLLSIGAERGECDEVGCGVDASYKNIINGATTGYSEAGANVVDNCTRLIKLSHTFFWASTPTCSNGFIDDECEDGDIGPLLLEPVGLSELVSVGELTKEEMEALLSCGLGPSQYCYVLLTWVGLFIMNGLKTGALAGGNGLEENLLRQITQLRAEYFNIGDNAAGRMPLAYVQLVQVLVDSLCILSPFAIYPELGILSIPATALLTLFFKGLLELSKSFLDPFGNEKFPGQNIRVDVLVSELNFGSSSRWVKAGESLPSNEFN